MGCGPAFTLQTRLPITASDVPSLEIEVCRNSKCLGGSFASATLDRSRPARASISFPDSQTREMTQSPFVTADVRYDEMFQVILDVEYWPTGSDVAEGDVYTVRV